MHQLSCRKIITFGAFQLPVLGGGEQALSLPTSISSRFSTLTTRLVVWLPTCFWASEIAWLPLRPTHLLRSNRKPSAGCAKWGLTPSSPPSVSGRNSEGLPWAHFKAQASSLTHPHHSPSHPPKKPLFSELFLQGNQVLPGLLLLQHLGQHLSCYESGTLIKYPGA